MNNRYLEDEEYKIAIKEYSEYKQRCYSLNQFDPKDSWAFEKRDEWSIKINTILLKHKILSKGFTMVDIEFLNEDSNKYSIKVWFNFIWTKNGELGKGNQEFICNSENEIIEVIDKFIEEYSVGDWTLKLNN